MSKPKAVRMSRTRTSTLPWKFNEGDVVFVEWDDLQSLRRAPWDAWAADEQTNDSGMSVGFIFDRPKQRCVELVPHLTAVHFPCPADAEHGEVLIPYTSIREIKVVHNPFA
jgi:hypothetical protein